MTKCTRAQYVEKVLEIHAEQQTYELGQDGSNGKCDCIGMGRGALHRAGVEDTPHMQGTNDAARSLDLNLQKIKSVKQLRVGDVVFKTRDKDDKNMPLPDKYRKGGSAYDPKWGEINFTHYGTVTSIDPLVITHMTSPRMKVDTSLGKWKYFGKAKPLVNAAGSTPVTPVVPDTAPANTPSDGSRAIVFAENGKPVKMREYPSTSCRTWVEVACGTEVEILEPGETWAKIRHGKREWYMMAKFLDVVGDGKGKY